MQESDLDNSSNNDDFTKQSMFNDYINYLSTDLGLSKSTCTTYKTQLRKFHRYLKSINVSIYSFKKHDLENYITYNQKEDNTKSRTINVIICSIRSLCRFFIIEKIRDIDPTENISPPKLEQRLPKLINSTTIKEILDTFDEDVLKDLRDKAMIVLLYASGLRSFELLKLKPENINFKDEYIRVVGKGDKERIVPIAKYALDLVLKYIHKYVAEHKLKNFNCDYIFQSPTKKKPLSRVSLFNTIKQHCLMAGVNTNVSAHVFRHAFATHLLDNGASLHVIQHLLGHSDISTTQIYTHVATSKLHKTYNKIHPRA